MAKPNPERCAETRKKIINSFWNLYGSGGMKAATVSAIVKDASIHRSTFYEYFNDSKAVLEAIEDDQIAIAEQYVAETIGKVDIVDPVAILMGIYGENADYWSVLLSDSVDTDFAQKLKSRIRPLVQARNGIDSDSEMSLYVFEFFITGMLASINLWYRRGCGDSAEALAETLRKLYLQGPAAFLPHN